MDLQYAVSGIAPSKINGQNSKGYMYKANHQYSSSENNNISYKSEDRNLDQLDELLLDLKNERQHTKDIDLVSSSITYKTIDRERADWADSVNITKCVNNPSQVCSKQVLIESDNTVNDTHTMKSSGYSNHAVETLKKGNFEITGIGYLSSTQNLLDNKHKICKISKPYNIDTKTSNTLSSTSFADDMQDIPLSDDILPLPGVKVTTTVRTYTYEIPADLHADGSGNRTLLYNTNNNYNTIKSDEANGVMRSPPSSIIYNSENYPTMKELPVIKNLTKIANEIDIKHNNEYSPPNYLQDGYSCVRNKTNTCKFNTSENSHSALNRDPNYHQESTSRRFNYQEVSKIVNSHNGNGSSDELKEVVHSRQQISPIDYPISNTPTLQPNKSSAVFQYSSKITSSSLLPDYKTPLHQTQPAPFPLVDGDFQSSNENLPQRVDDLMQSLGDSNTADKSELKTNLRKREIETAVATPTIPKIPTINKVGKDVYYPPGHDLMLVKHEEMTAGSAAGSRWAKGSGMYEYDSGYKSKSKTKSGGAVIPVCLPLCCAMPCSIM